MKNCMKKSVVGVLVGCLLASFAGCAGGRDSAQSSDAGSSEVSESEITEPIPEYQSEKDFMIGMWLGVPDALKQYDEDTGGQTGTAPIDDKKFLQYYKDMKAAGFTVADTGYGESSRAYNIRALNAAKQVGMGQIIDDKSILGYLMNDSLSDDQIIRRVTSEAEYFKDHEAFWGLRVKDEPTYNDIPKYRRAQELFQRIFPGKKFYVNLLPIVADKNSITANYGNYIKQYTENIKEDYISFDHYVLKSGASGNYLLQNLVANLTAVKRNAPALDAWFIAQSIQFGGTNRGLTSVADTNFQAYSALACGYAGISWFCYFSPPPFDGATTFGDGVIDRAGNKTQTYEFVKETNLALAELSDVYFNFEWKGIIGNIGTENENGGDNDDFAMSAASVVASERITSLTTQQDTLVGVFEDTEGRDGYMFVNYSEPSAGKENKVRVKFENCAGALVYANGEKSVVKARGGVIEFKQNAGDGFFVIPLQ